MGVRRTHLEFEGQFTQVPNAWARDERLSRKARGLLIEIMSHRVGWHVSVSGLQNAGTEGRDAIKSALVELKELGYLVVSQSRGDRGRFGEVEYELHDPATGDGFSVHGGLTANRSTANGSTASGQSAPYKNTIPIEDHLVEDHTSQRRGADDRFILTGRRERYVSELLEAVGHLDVAPAVCQFLAGLDYRTASGHMRQLVGIRAAYDAGHGFERDDLAELLEAAGVPPIDDASWAAWLAAEAARAPRAPEPPCRYLDSGYCDRHGLREEDHAHA